MFPDFRGFTIRKRFGIELEERFKRILNYYDDKFEAHKALLREGLKNEDAAFIVQRWYKKKEKVKKSKVPSKDFMHPKLRQADLIHFAQNVSKIFVSRTYTSRVQVEVLTPLSELFLFLEPQQFITI